MEKQDFMKSATICGLLALSLAGCVTTSGSYRVSAVTNDGVPVPTILNVQGSHIYSARNALCSAHRGAMVSIVDVGTGKDLSGESPYKCK
jgi:hypothetical protein